MLSLLGSLAIASDQLDIIGYYTQSAAIRAARGDSIATPAVSLEHGRGRLKDRSQGAPASYEGSRFLRECGGLKPRSTKPLDPGTGQPPPPLGPPWAPVDTRCTPPRAAFRRSVSYNFTLNFSGGSRNNFWLKGTT